MFCVTDKAILMLLLVAPFNYERLDIHTQRNSGALGLAKRKVPKMVAYYHFKRQP